MRRINRPTCPNPTALRTNYRHRDNKQALVNASYGKCMYCEEKIMSSQFGDVEHIKPKSKYPELEYDWNNLGLVCRRCNNAKLDKFDEDTPFINPYDENPEEHIIAFGTLLKQRQGSERGELTIAEINLNRPELLEKRLERINMIEKAVNSCFRSSNESLKNNALEELQKEADVDKEYSLCVKCFLESHNII